MTIENEWLSTNEKSELHFNISYKKKPLQPSLNRCISGTDILWFFCSINMFIQLPLNLKQVMIATTGAITVPNIGDGFLFRA